jgi:hypothetical protein
MFGPFAPSLASKLMSFLSSPARAAEGADNEQGLPNEGGDDGAAERSAAVGLRDGDGQENALFSGLETPYDANVCFSVPPQTKGTPTKHRKISSSRD